MIFFFNRSIKGRDVCVVYWIMVWKVESESQVQITGYFVTFTFTLMHLEMKWMALLLRIRKRQLIFLGHIIRKVGLENLTHTTSPPSYYRLVATSKNLLKNKDAWWKTKHRTPPLPAGISCLILLVCDTYCSDDIGKMQTNVQTFNNKIKSHIHV